MMVPRNFGGANPDAMGRTELKRFGRKIVGACRLHYGGAQLQEKLKRA